MKNDCPFCDYQGPSKLLHDFGSCFVSEPLDPVTEGHALVIPREHVADFGAHVDITAETAKCAVRFLRIQGIEDANLITSRGPAATQTVGHLHMHIVPRRDGDGLQLPWTAA